MPRNGTLENPSQCEGFETKEKGLGTSRADVSGNARHFCEVEFNFIQKHIHRLLKILGSKTEERNGLTV